ncbi:MAG TPA: hypothetical protein VK540_27800 [Polyangiaceae bacterium]|nr:hypothetical protein [Polyangiaceae bacterium]
MKIEIVNEQFQLPTLWQIVRDIRATLGVRFAHLDPQLLDAITLTVSELAENIVKFAAPDASHLPSIELEATPTEIRVRSENTVRSSEDAQVVLTTIERIRSHDNPTALFAQSIEESMDRRSEGSRQGFYQIAAVAGFRLEGELVGDRLVVVAERRLK